PYGTGPTPPRCAGVLLSKVVGTYRYQIGRLTSATRTSHNVSATVSNTNSGAHRTTSRTTSRRVAGSRTRSPSRARSPRLPTGRYGAGIGGRIRCRSTLARARVATSPAAGRGRAEPNPPGDAAA